MNEIQFSISGNVIVGHQITINNDLKDQQMNFKLINTREKMGQFLDTMIDNLRQANPDFVDSSQFSQAVIAFYNKYK